jgi:hypothetical protein
MRAIVNFGIGNDVFYGNGMIFIAMYMYDRLAIIAIFLPLYDHLYGSF